MNVKKWISNRTGKVRYYVVLKVMKVATPSLYKDLSMLECIRISVPRPMIDFASALFDGKPVVGAEIGVFQGANAKSILQTLNVKKLFLIDPYSTYLLDGEPSIRRHAFPIALKTLSNFKDKIEWVKKTSEHALQQFPNNFFDFVYVDGNHAYDYVKKDLEGYWKKVKKGGILGGHDFFGYYQGVVKAVTEFSKQMNQPFWGKLTDFWFIKDY